MSVENLRRELAPGSVELHLRAGEPGSVVTPAAADEPVEPASDCPSTPGSSALPPRRWTAATAARGSVAAGSEAYSGWVR